MTTKYMVLTASAQMPNSCWGVYKRIALVEVDPAALEAAGLERPRMISPRAKGIVRIVRTWEALNVGRTERCAYQVARREAEAQAEALNAGLASW